MENLFKNEKQPDLRIYGVDNFSSGVYFLNEADLYHAVANYEIPFWSNIIILFFFLFYFSYKNMLERKMLLERQIKKVRWVSMPWNLRMN